VPEAQSPSWSACIRSVTEGLTADTAADMAPEADLRGGCLRSPQSSYRQDSLWCEHATCGSRGLVQCTACVKLVTKACHQAGGKGQPWPRALFMGSSRRDCSR
jgi:hypothetical protein